MSFFFVLKTFNIARFNLLLSNTSTFCDFDKLNEKFMIFNNILYYYNYMLFYS